MYLEIKKYSHGGEKRKKSKGRGYHATEDESSPQIPKTLDS